MAQIVETISGDRRIQLSNEDFVRQMSFGANWNKIRVSLRLSINGTANISQPQLFIGVCSGLRNTFKSSITDFCFGLTCTGSNAGTIQDLNYNIGPPAWYQSSSSIGFSLVYRLQNVTTRLNAGTSQTTFIASTANNPPSHFSVDITRTGNVYALTQFNQPGSQANVQAGQTLKQLLTGQDAETGLQSWSNNTNKTGFTVNSVADNHLCDCVNISWSMTTPTLEVSDIQVVKFS